MIGELLYGLSAMEERSAPVIQRQNLFASASLANTSVVVATVGVPPDKYYVLMSCIGSGIAGAAQNCTNLTVTIQPEAGGNPSSVIAAIGTSVQQRNVVQARLGGGILLSPGEVLTVSGTFDAGAAANSVNLHAQGFLIPKGNLQIR